MFLLSRHKGVLNEVLSLNAQECRHSRVKQPLRYFLNEVLSLNAQESHHGRPFSGDRQLLNEVLSLNAQEFFYLGTTMAEIMPPQ